jgi:hypothetical protein
MIDDLRSGRGTAQVSDQKGSSGKLALYRVMENPLD